MHSGSTPLNIASAPTVMTQRKNGTSALGQVLKNVRGIDPALRNGSS
jgi:hypothetical protein